MNIRNIVTIKQNDLNETNFQDESYTLYKHCNKPKYSIYKNINDIYWIQCQYNTSNYTSDNIIKNIIQYFKYPFTKIYKFEILSYDKTTSNNIIIITLNLSIYKNDIDENTHILDYLSNNIPYNHITNKTLTLLSNVDITNIDIILNFINDINFPQYLLIANQPITLIYDKNTIFIKLEKQILNTQSILYNQQKIYRDSDPTKFFILRCLNNIIYENLIITKKLYKKTENTYCLNEPLYINDNINFIDNIKPYNIKTIEEENDNIIYNNLQNIDIKHNLINYNAMFLNNLYLIDGTNGILNNEYINNIYRYDLTNVGGDIIISYINCINNKKYDYYVKYFVTLEYLTENLIAVDDIKKLIFEQEPTNNILEETYANIKSTIKSKITF